MKIEKVLVAEDHESASISVQKTLAELGIEDVEHAYYCDDAFLKIRNMQAAGKPFELLIVDLGFEEDQNKQQIAGGPELIAAARNIQPELKVIVFSAENRPAVIEPLFRELKIDGFVRKARNDARELRAAITSIARNQQYLPRQLTIQWENKTPYNFSDYDITLIKLLAGGMPQKNIPTYLQEQQIRPSGLSSVEKRLNLIRSELAFSKNEQLIAFCKDMGII